MSLTSKPIVYKFISVILLIIILTFIMFYYFSSIFIVLIFAAILITSANYTMNLYNKIFEKVKVSKIMKTTIGYLFVFIILIFIITLITSSVGEIINTVNNPEFGENPFLGIYKENIQPVIPKYIEEQIATENNFKKVNNYLISFVSSSVSKIGAFIFSSILIVPLMFLLYFRNKGKIIDKIVEIAPMKFQKATKNALTQIQKQIKDFFHAKVIESLVIGIICGIGFYFIGIEGWLFLAILAGFFNIVPYIGPILGAILPIFVAITHSINMVYLVLIIILFAQAVDNFYLIPFMISDKVKMDSLLTIILILIASQLFGAFGMIFVIPMYLTAKIIIVESYKELVKIYDK